MNTKLVFLTCIVFLLSACTSSTQTSVSEETVFEGEGKDWYVKYIFNPDLYNEKFINWVELVDKGKEFNELNLQDINIELKSREGILTGNLGEMKTEIHKNSISFMVGTINRETYREDEFELIINYNEKKDVIKLKIK